MPNFSGLWTSRQQLQAVGNGTWTGLPLFTFTTFTFTNASATGQNGPTLGQCQTAYAGEVWLSSYSFVYARSPAGSSYFPCAYHLSILRQKSLNA